MLTLNSLYSFSKPVLRRFAALLLMTLTTQTQSGEAAEDLFSQILSLQSQMKIKITGMERIQNEEPVVTRGNPEQQIEQLLSSFNHIVTRDAQGQIERIVIVNKKQKTETERIVLPTTHQGNHFMVSVALSGDGSIWETVDMIIDTGADLVVLPESMIAQLGLTNSRFTHQKMQTANGTTDAKIGKLQTVKIAGETVENVEVAFIADKLLGKNKLLGMSVLGRYQLNIDDTSQVITLFKK
jgi:clan AA aspartic protease (TIGR02281 family)